WYSQAGTPMVRAQGDYDAANHSWRLTLTQTTPPTPGQSVKTPQRIPMRVALFDANGLKLETSLNGVEATEHVVLLERASDSFVFGGVASPPRPSLNRGFSAPIRLADDLTEADRGALAGHDDDPFAQWEALQTIARALVLDAVRGGGAREPDQQRLRAFVEALRHSTVRAATSDPAFAALLLYLPTVGELVLDVGDADPSAIHAVRSHVRRAVARTLEDLLLSVLDRREPAVFDPSAGAA